MDKIIQIYDNSEYSIVLGYLLKNIREPDVISIYMKENQHKISKKPGDIKCIMEELFNNYDKTNKWHIDYKQSKTITLIKILLLNGGLDASHLSDVVNYAEKTKSDYVHKIIIPKIVKAFVKYGLEDGTPEWIFALNYVCGNVDEKDSLKNVQTLLGNIKNPSSLFTIKFNLLQTICIYKNIHSCEALKLALSYVDPNCEFDGKSVIVWAACFGNMSAINILLDAGANVNGKTFDLIIKALERKGIDGYANEKLANCVRN